MQTLVFFLVARCQGSKDSITASTIRRDCQDALTPVIPRAGKIGDYLEWSRRFAQDSPRYEALLYCAGQDAEEGGIYGNETEFVNMFFHPRDEIAEGQALQHLKASLQL